MNGKQTFQNKDITYGGTSSSCILRQTFIKPLNDLAYDSGNFTGTNINDETLRGRSEYIRQILELWSVDVCKKQDLEKNLVIKNGKKMY